MFTWKQHTWADYGFSYLLFLTYIFVLALLTETGILKKKLNTHAQLIFVLSLITVTSILIEAKISSPERPEQNSIFAIKILHCDRVAKFILQERVAIELHKLTLQ